MSPNVPPALQTAGNDSKTDSEPRDRRALTECMTVLPKGGDIFTVVGENGGGEYRVDARETRCTCPDHKYRDARCKHIRRVEIVCGDRPIPGNITPEDVDDQLGQHVDGVVRHVATDGGTQLIDGGDQDGGRPDGCECWSTDQALACFTCYKARFETPNPETPGATEGDS